MKLNFVEWLISLEQIIQEGADSIIDPYFLDDPQLGFDSASKAKTEFYILFTVLSAGKSSSQQIRGLSYFLSLEKEGDTPFEKVKIMWKKGTIVRNLAQSGLGTFNRFARTFIMLAHLDLDELRGMDEEQMEAKLKSIPNISDKIVNFIKMYTHKDKLKEEPAVLDRHILRYMRGQLLELHNEGVKFPREITGGKSLKKLATMVPEDSPKGEKYKFWTGIWRAILKARGLSDLDVWRMKAMIGVDPLWKWKATGRSGVREDRPVYTDEAGRDIIDLSIDREGHTRGSRIYPPVKKDIFHTLDYDPETMSFPDYTGPRKPWTTGGGFFDAEGRRLKRLKRDSYAYEDDSPFDPAGTQQARDYRERWLKQFNHYRGLGLYRDLEDDDKAAYDAYMKKLGLKDEI